MDELNIEELKQLVIFYNKRAADAESKNAEFQLITNRLKIEKNNLESKLKSAEDKVEALSKPVEAKEIKKPLARKTTKTK